MREPVEASGISGSCPEAGGRQWKSVEDKEGVGRGSGGSEEVRKAVGKCGRGGKGTGSNGTLQEDEDSWWISGRFLVEDEDSW